MASQKKESLLCATPKEPLHQDRSTGGSAAAGGSGGGGGEGGAHEPGYTALELQDSAEGQAPRDATDEDVFAASLLVGSFLVREKGVLDLEVGSAYGAAILMPQIARTAGWPSYLTCLSVRSYIFLFLNIGIQFVLLQLISREQEVMNAYAGQMFLCNFASGVRGPAGTLTTPARTFPFSQWTTRVFVKDALKQVFPDKAENIEASVDPGEYALESYGARWVCCYLFVMATMSELLLVIQMGRTLFTVPTRADKWIEHVQEAKDGDGNHVSWLDRVDIQIAGMPLNWKIFYFLVILVPKCIIWKLCTQVGIDYLMDTSTIEDLIINSVAMAFILNIDEMICGTLMSEATRVMLLRCQGYTLYDTAEESRLSRGEIMQRFGANQKMRNMGVADVVRLVPWKLIFTLMVTAALIGNYYYRHCTMVNGELVSRPMRVPKNTDFSFLRTVLPNFIDGEWEEDVFWSMPEER